MKKDRVAEGQLDWRLLFLLLQEDEGMSVSKASPTPSWLVLSAHLTSRSLGPRNRSCSKFWLWPLE